MGHAGENAITDVQDHLIRRLDCQWTDYGVVVLVKQGAAEESGRGRKKETGELRVKLDEVGSFAWRMMDGKTVGDVYRALKVEFPDERDIPDRLAKFVAMLEVNGFISLQSAQN